MKVKLLRVVIVLSTYSCVKKSLDVEKPTFDTPVTFSGQTADAMTLTWAAKDDLSKDEDLSYKVVYSMSDNISTEADAEANGTVLMDWTINTLTANMTSLDMVTTYYVTVLVRDEKSNTALSS
ncbi:MAG: fibronectin type III domain-containing protein, partial [Bdellovibrionaceae bacterium]|nr:fibronectin type III domain-containing protein [Pseudobdellovibrionaceae bacterium]